MEEENWTLATLKKYFELRINSLEQSMNERFIGSDKYHEKITDEYDKRYQQRFEASQDAIKAAFSTAGEALAEAKNASITGFEKSNEWRASLNDVMSTRLSRGEFDAQHASLTKEVSEISLRIRAIEARTVGVGSSWRDVMTLLATIAAVGAVLLVLFHR